MTHEIQRYLPPAPLVKIEQVLSYITEIRKIAHVVGPLHAMDYLPPGYRVSVRVELADLTIDEKGNGRDVYRHPVWCKPHERGLSAVMLRKLANAAALDFLESDRSDRGDDANFCRWSMLAAVPQPDGTKSLRRCSKKLDLRPGSPDLKNFGEKQETQARANIESLAESKCLTRLTKICLALDHKYTAEELAKPFVVPVLVWEPDMSDPEIKRMVTAARLGLTDRLYGQQRPPLITTGEVIDISGDDDDDPTPSSSAGASAPPPAPWESPPPTNPTADAPIGPAAPATFSLPCTTDQIASLPADMVGGSARRVWVDRMNRLAIAIVERHGTPRGRELIADAVGTVDLSTADEKMLTTIGQRLSAIPRKGVA